MPKLLYITTQDKFFLSHIKERAVYARSKGFTVYVAAQRTSDEYVRRIKSLGFQFFDTQIERQEINPISIFKSIYKLLTIYKSIKPDIVHQLGAKAIILGTFARLLAGLDGSTGIINAPIGMGYIFASRDLKAALLRPLVQKLYELTLNPKKSEVIFENHEDLNFFVNMGALNANFAHCIYGAGVDTKVYVPSEAKNNVFTVVMASRLIKEKGVFEFYKAAKYLKENNIKIRMQLIGVPDYGNPSSLTKEEFDTIASDGAVECLGYREDVAEILKKAHVCCLPSYYREGLPRCLIEGASCGLAIVTTDTIGCRETVIDKQNGYLILPKSIKSLVTAIENLAKDSEKVKKMGVESRKLALAKFDTELICSKTYAVYLKFL